MDNVIYVAVSRKKEFVYCAQLLLKTLEKYSSKVNFDFLVLHDDVLEDCVKNSIKSDTIKVITYKPRKIEYPDHEFFYRLRIFDYPEYKQYKKAFYLDSDILVTTDITKYLDMPLGEEEIGVFPESEEPSKHNEYYYNPFYPYKYSDEVISMYEKNKIYVFNSGTYIININEKMRVHFDEIISMIIAHKQKTFVDQPFFNFYFNKLSLARHIFSTEDYKLGVNLEVFTPNCILHFTGQGIGVGIVKFNQMFGYFRRFIK